MKYQPTRRSMGASSCLVTADLAVLGSILPTSVSSSNTRTSTGLTDAQLTMELKMDWTLSSGLYTLDDYLYEFGVLFRPHPHKRELHRMQACSTAFR